MSSYSTEDMIDIIQFAEMAFTEYIYQDAEDIAPILEECGKGPIF